MHQHLPASIGIVLVLLLGVTAVSCSGDDSGVGATGSVVGGRCDTDADCANRCVNDNDFPGGYCTRTCTTDADCPSGTLCIEKKEGLCLLPCEGAVDCAPFGPGYMCESKERKGMRDVEALVCVGD